MLHAYYDDKNAEAKQEAQTALDEMKNARDKAHGLINYIESSSWEGSFREGVLMQLEIMRDYMNVLIPILEEQKTVVDNLPTKVSDFLGDAIFTDLKGIDV